jgi:hypothetical protein
VLEDIPYQSEIEVPFFVSKSGLCDNFKDIEIQITAACEEATSSSAVKQYPVQYDANTKSVQILYNSTLGANQASAKFDVVWAPVPRVYPATYAPTTFPTRAPSTSTKVMNADSLGSSQNGASSASFKGVMAAVSFLTVVSLMGFVWLLRTTNASASKVDELKEELLKLTKAMSASAEYSPLLERQSYDGSYHSSGSMPYATQDRASFSDSQHSKSSLPYEQDRASFKGSQHLSDRLSHTGSQRSSVSFAGQERTNSLAYPEEVHVTLNASDHELHDNGQSMGGSNHSTEAATHQYAASRDTYEVVPFTENVFRKFCRVETV